MEADIVSIERIETRQGDGRLSVTLLALGAILIAATVFQLTTAFVGPRDTLAARVPIDAAVYLHVNVDRLPPSAAILLPENIQADEIAEFAVIDENDDLVWGKLFGWRNGRQPTAEEKQLLEARQGLRLDDRTYLLGSVEPLPEPALARLLQVALAEDNSARRALTTVRSLAPIQGYFNPAMLPPRPLSETAALLKQLEPTVFAFNPETDGLYAVFMPARVAAAFPELLGFAPNRRTTATSRTSMPVSAQLSVSSDRPIFDPLAVFFQKIESARAELGLDETIYLGKAREEMRRLLSRPPATLSIFRPGPAGTDVDFIVEYPDIEPADLGDAVTDYINAALPDSRPLNLPDDDIIMEIRFDPEKYALTPLDAPDGRVRTVSVDAAGLQLAVSPMAEGGSIMASSPELLTARTEEASDRDGNGFGPSRCSSVTGSRLVLSGEMFSEFYSIPGLNRILAGLAVQKLKFGLFIDNNDGVLISCGYYR